MKGEKSYELQRGNEKSDGMKKRLPPPSGARRRPITVIPA
jgi:hypothetical protein